MNTRLKASLERAIDKWMERESQSADWIDGIVGNKTVLHMTVAAASVLEACEESQQYAKLNGFTQLAAQE